MTFEGTFVNTDIRLALVGSGSPRQCTEEQLAHARQYLKLCEELAAEARRREKPC